MKKLHLVSKEVLELESKEMMYLWYYLTECGQTDSSGNQFYGVQIEKKLEEENGHEIECIDYISSSKEFILEMIHKLVQHSVTPMGMVYTVDDLVTEKLCS